MTSIDGQKPVAVDSKSPFRYVGARRRRIDGREKVTGEARFGADVPLDDLLYARLVTSIHARAHIRHVDRDSAEQMPGVVRVLIADDLPLVAADSGLRKRDPLARGMAIYHGHPIAVVVATSDELAEDAAQLVDVEYEPVEAMMDPFHAMDQDAPRVRDTDLLQGDEEAKLHGASGPGSQSQEAQRSRNISNAVVYQRGDIEAGFAQSSVIIERSFSAQWFHQCYLEPQTATAAWDGDRVNVWTSTQGVFTSQTEVSAALGIDDERVNIIPMMVGGGFGGKLSIIEALVAAVARVVDKPVRLTYNRTEEFLCANPNGSGAIQLRLGCDNDGLLRALAATTVFDTGTAPSAAALLAPQLIGGQYRCEHFDIHGYEVFTNRTGAGSFRGPGGPQTFFALETVIDELAERVGLDPLQFRLRNAVTEGDIRPHGLLWPSIGMRQVIERARNHELWTLRDQFGRGRRDQNERLLGVGAAVVGWQGSNDPAGSICRLSTDGNIIVELGAVDISGVHSSLILMAAEGLEIDPDLIRIETVPSDRAPQSGQSGGSQITYTVGPAVYQSATDLRKKLLESAGRLLEAAPEDLEIDPPAIRVRGVPDRSISLTELATSGETNGIEARSSSSLSDYSPAFSAHIGQIAVNPTTGVVDVLRYVVIQDVGRAINPAEIEAQIHGGVAQGLGWALYEELLYSSGGQVLTGSFLDYHLAKAHQLPNVEIDLMEIPAPLGPFGARPVGEPPVIPVTAVIANAIHNATGVRMTRIPIIPERLLKAMHDETRQVGDQQCHVDPAQSIG